MAKGTLFFAFFLGGTVAAQVAHNPDIPLKNWPAPLYWQPSQAEHEAAGGKLRAAIRTAAPGAAAEPVFVVFVAMTPCRVVDTRTSSAFPSPFGTPTLAANTTRSFPIQSSTLCTIPSTAQAYSFNVTVIPPGPLGYLTIWPTGLSQPNAVTLDDFPTGDIRNNAAIVPAGTPNGSVDVHVNAATDFVLDINGYYTAPSDLNSNTALGQGALVSNTTGFSNTATGFQALFTSTNGDYNTANGYQALYNTTGNINTASGAYALFHNSSGSGNTASGYQALVNNTTGNNNTASGVNALFSNTTAQGNTGFGSQALYSNTTGYSNTAVGSNALYYNRPDSVTTSAIQNTAIGDSALFKNTSGSQNTADGYYALYSNTGGYFNSALGHLALSNTTGDNNTALGASAGINISTGSNNIDIANNGETTDGTAFENGVIRIGDSLQTSFFAAGIAGVAVSNQATVLINTSTGQLGTVVSSRRYKEEIEDLGDASVGLMRLRPVKFRYKKPYEDGSRPLDYGLIAEEVAEIYPDLVAKGSDGQIETVQYHKLIPMLLNELQKQQAQVSALQREHETIQLLQAQVSALQKVLDSLEAFAKGK